MRVPRQSMSNPVRSLFFGALAFAACFAHAQGSRLVIVSWDGAPDWVVDRLVNEGRLPNVARMRAQGAFAERVVMGMPSVTAAGHAILWTGAWPALNGITGNEVPVLPRKNHTVLETRSGFLSDALLAEPVWLSALKGGRSVALLSATQSYPPVPYVEAIREMMAADERAGRTYRTLPSRFIALSGFERPLSAPKVYTDVRALADSKRLGREGKEITIRVADDSFLVFFPRGEDGTYKECTIYRLQEGGLKFAAYMSYPDIKFSNPIEVRKGADWGLLTFCLMSLAPDMSSFLLYQGDCDAVLGHCDEARLRAYVFAAGGFHDLPIREVYARGGFGPTLWQGGSGEAEERLLLLVERDFERLSQGLEHALKFFEADLITHYSPAIDTFGHLVMGVLDPSSPRYSKELADKLWPVYARFLELADKSLGRILQAAGPTSLVALVSDHGMEGIAKRVSVNRILVDAGLAVSTNGHDVSVKSLALSPPWMDIGVVVNDTSWKDGVVDADRRREILERAKAALLAAKDPATGTQIIRRVYDASEVVGGGGDAGCDLYLDFAPGYEPASGLSDRVVMDADPVLGAGTHGFLPERRSMNAIFYVLGPGIAQGRNLGVIQGVDIIPSLCPLAGIPTPRDAVGRNLRLRESGEGDW